MISRVLKVFGFLVVLVAASVGGKIGREVVSQFTKLSKSEMREAVISGLEEAARINNAKGPVMVDEETRLDYTAVGPDARATYLYSFPNNTSHEVTKSIIEERVEPLVRKNVCSNADMRPSIEYGAKYVYSYSGNDGIAIHSFSIDARRLRDSIVVSLTCS